MTDSGRVLTINVFDPAGRSGSLVDWATVLKLGAAPLTVISGIVLAEADIAPLETNTLGRQIRSFADPQQVMAVKTGMLVNRENVEAVATFFEDPHYHVRPLVVDASLEAPDETALLSSTAISLIKMRLLPLADVAVAYLSEAERLSGLPVRDINQMKEAAEAIHIYGAKHVLVKADHKVEDEWVDILYNGDEHQLLFTKQEPPTDLRRRRDLFSAALTAYLSERRDVRDAIEAAKQFEMAPEAATGTPISASR